MCDFKPGDEVVCVDAGAWRGPTPGVPRVPAGIVEGGVYTISAIGRAEFTDDPAVWLIEAKNRFGRGYRAARFRKVQRRDATIERFTQVPVGDTSRWDKSRQRESV